MTIKYNNIIPCHVTRDGYVTIPESMRKKYDIQTGDIVLMMDNDKRLQIITKKEYLAHIEE